MSRILENGNVLINGKEFPPDTPMNMYWAECESCGWHTINNSFWAEHEFDDHECLTKAGKPRKKPPVGFIRNCTAIELAKFKEA